MIEVRRSEDHQRAFQEGTLEPAFERAGTRRVTPPCFPAHHTLPPPEALAGLEPAAT